MLRKQKVQKGFKTLWWLLMSLLAAWAPGMDMAVQRKLRPDALDLGGYVYQAVGRTFEAIQPDSLSLACVLLVVLWLTRRYLYHKPAKTGVGEYVLCGFFTVMQLLNTAIRHAGTVQVLGENMFQMLKVMLYLPGMFTLLLCGLRALNELLHWRPEQKRCSLWDRYPFLFPFLVLCVAWLPHLIVKYPGIIPMDTALQYHQYVGIEERTTPHPVFGTLLYGFVINAARESQRTNLIYFTYTLVQTAVFIAVLAYALSVLNRRKAPMWACWFALAMFALSPIYAGWTMVMGKDSSYLITCMLAGALLLDNMGDKRLDQSPWRMALLGVDLVLMMLVRNNGITIVVPLLLVMLIGLICEKAGRKRCLRFAAFVCAVLVAALGVKEGIIQGMGFEKRSQNDWMSLMFQQTGRVVTQHDEELPDHEKEVIGRMFTYEAIQERYRPAEADQMRWNYPPDSVASENNPGFPTDDGRSNADQADYLKVWLAQLKRYPLDYVDALLHMNGILFDLQNNWPVYFSLVDHSLTGDYVYPEAFNDMSYYDAEQIAPLNGWQTALTEWYHRMSELPLVGWLFSMGFCMDVLLALCYLCWVYRRRQMLCLLVIGLVVGVSGLFCAMVYLRYLLPMVGMLPLWPAAWTLCDEPRCLKEE